MKRLSETKAIARLQSIRSGFADQIRSNFEHRARSCLTCETPGACCLDAHFVNVRITRLEAAAIWRRLTELPIELRRKVEERSEVVVEKHGLDRSDESGAKTYPCPLFETGIGCLVHDHAKPLPCIAHACYDRKEDLPPDELLNAREIDVMALNERTYGNCSTAMPLPIAITQKFSAFRQGSSLGAKVQER